MGARSGILRSLALVGVVALLSSGCAFVQRASVDSAGQPAADASNPTISATGRYVAFTSISTLDPGDTNGAHDIFVRDTASATTTRVSVSTAGTLANASSLLAAISANGRYVAFESLGTNLVTGDTNNNMDIFVRDTVAGTTTRVSVATAGTQGNLSSYEPAISADGRYVAFSSYSSNLVPSDTNGKEDVFVRDTVAGTTTRVSVGSGGTQSNDFSEFAAISADGRYVGFMSAATTLVTGDTNGVEDVFVRDSVAGTTTRVSVGPGGVEGNGGSQTSRLASAFSADGRYVAFASGASNLVAGDTNGMFDVFVRDTVAGTTTRVSVDGASNEIVGESARPSISADGRFVAFQYSTDLVPGHQNDPTVVFVRDIVAGTTTKVSVDTTGQDANGASYWPTISADGRYVGFLTEATNLVPGDTTHPGGLVIRANPQPTATSVAPSTVGHGASTPISITGSGFVSGAVVVVDGSGTSVSAVTVVSPTQIIATITVDAGAPLTARNVWVELPGTGPGVTAGALGICVHCVTVT